MILRRLATGKPGYPRFAQMVGVLDFLWAIVPLLMLGGAFLCYEGAHKDHHKLFHREADKQEKERLKKAFRDPKVDLVAFEKKKIKGAIRSDFILSAEHWVSQR